MWEVRKVKRWAMEIILSRGNKLSWAVLQVTGIFI
jgi:hypothetical protein